ncbi:MAG: CdaR family protein [Thermoflexales bacterium]|nr:CdaR family protein [Thermoflexales bacterium]
MSILRRSLQWLVGNLGLFSLALVLAVFVWAVASLQQDPILEESFVAPVVIVQQPPAEYILSASTLPQAVSLRVRAPRSTLEALRESAPQVPVDLSTLSPGTHTLELKPALSARPALVVAARPVTASVLIERVAQRTLPVRIVTLGAPAIGYRVFAPSAEPASVSVSGSQHVVSQVVSVDAVVSIEGARSLVEQTVRVQARNNDGAPINGLRIVPDAVLVRVPLEQLSNYRDLAVRARIFGQPANGYAVTGVDYAPQVVTVFGPREVVQQLVGFIETFEVNIAGSTQDVEKRVGLNVPPNVSLVGDNLSVLVRVRIEAQQGARTVPRQPRVIGLDASRSATISPPIVDIVLAGPLPVLNNLREDDVQVVVDASALGAGEHTVTPRVIVQEGLTAQSIIPAQLQVRITNRSTP